MKSGHIWYGFVITAFASYTLLSLQVDFTLIKWCQWAVYYICCLSSPLGSISFVSCCWKWSHLNDGVHNAWTYHTPFCPQSFSKELKFRLHTLHCTLWFLFSEENVFLMSGWAKKVWEERVSLIGKLSGTSLNAGPQNTKHLQWGVNCLSVHKYLPQVTWLRVTSPVFIHWV